MGRRLTLSVLAFSLGAGSAFAAQPAPVATLTDVSGTVLVDSGKGFVPAQGDVSLSSGDRVLISRESAAKIAYTGSKDCSQTLTTRGVTKVSASCPAGTSGVVGSVTTKKNEKKTVGSAPIIQGGGMPASTAAAAAGVGPFGLPAGAVAAGVIGTVGLGTVIAVAASDSGGSSTPVSP